MTDPVATLTPDPRREALRPSATGGTIDGGALSAAFRTLLNGSATRSLATALDALRTIPNEAPHRIPREPENWASTAAAEARLADHDHAPAPEADDPDEEHTYDPSQSAESYDGAGENAFATDGPPHATEAATHDPAVTPPPAAEANPAAAGEASAGPTAKHTTPGSSAADLLANARTAPPQAAPEVVDDGVAQQLARQAASTNTSPAAATSPASTAKPHDGIPAGVRVNVQVESEAARLVSQPLRSLTPAAATAAMAASSGGRAASTAKGDGGTGGGPNTTASSTSNPAAAQGLMATASPSAQGQNQGGNASLLANGGKGAALATMASPAASGSGATGDFSGLLSTGRGERAASLPGATTASSASGSRDAPPADQVSVHITRAIKGGLDRVRIQLQPETLGRVEVKLEFGKDGRVHALITAETREAVDLLRADARGLERALQDAGVKTDSNSLSFSLRGEQHDHAGTRGGSPSSASGQTANDTEDDAPIAPTSSTGLPGGITADGRVDIRA